jgi:DNA polymerase
MRNLVLDFESFYSKDVTLKKLSTTDYICHPEFEVLGAGVWYLDEDPEPTYLEPEPLKAWLAAQDWAQVRLVAHHTHFDGFVLAHHYRYTPAAYACTMAMADALLNGVCRSGLDAVADYLGVGRKIEGALENVKGLHFKDLTQEQREGLIKYGAHDAYLSGEIFKLLWPQLPETEQRLMSLTLRLFMEPQLELDRPLIEEALNDASEERDELIEATGYKAEQLSSNTEFVEILTKELDRVGEELPVKWSEKQERYIPALAKSDQGMHRLLEHSDPVIQTLAHGRLAVKSTIGVTRAQRMLDLYHNCGGKFPIAYHYARPHTWRWSGGNKMNPQNLVRGGKLRRAIRAPKGYLVLAGDLSQIEPRTTAMVAGESWLVQAFRDKQDPYNLMASDIYDIEVNRKNGDPEHADMGFIGKCAVIGLGYQMSAPTFQATLAMGTLGPKKIVDIEFAGKVVYTYRSKNSQIVALWAKAQQWIEWLAAGVIRESDCGRFVIDGKRKRIWMPNGTYLFYPELHWSRTHGEYRYSSRLGATKIWKKIYGGKLVENLIQKASRDIIAEMMLAIDERYPVVMTTHDECPCLIPENEHDEAVEWVGQVMRTAPAWMPELPVDCELAAAPYYCK